MGKISWEEWEDVPYIEGGNVWREIDLKRYELKDHLGNVRVTLSDIRLSTIFNSTLTSFRTEVVSMSDYYAFGMLMVGRNWSAGEYRYGFQGQEMDNEEKGLGNAINYTYRVHDPRLGRFLSIDPLSPKYPFYSPYAFSGNRVVDCVELEGLEPSRTKEYLRNIDIHEQKYTYPSGTVITKVDGWWVVYQQSKYYVNVDFYKYWNADCNEWAEYYPESDYQQGSRISGEQARLAVNGTLFAIGFGIGGGIAIGLGFELSPLILTTETAVGAGGNIIANYVTSSEEYTLQDAALDGLEGGCYSSIGGAFQLNKFKSALLGGTLAGSKRFVKDQLNDKGISVRGILVETTTGGIFGGAGEVAGGVVSNWGGKYVANYNNHLLSHGLYYKNLGFSLKSIANQADQVHRAIARAYDLCSPIGIAGEKAEGEANKVLDSTQE